MFIGGQSLGGLIASTAALQLQSSCAGLVLTSPAMDVDKNLILHVQSALAGPLSAAMPWARIVPAVKTEHLSEDVEVPACKLPRSCAAFTESLFDCICTLRQGPVSTPSELHMILPSFPAGVSTIQARLTRD